MSRPYNNPTDKHRRRVAALARMRPPKLDDVPEEQRAAAVDRFEKEKAALEERIQRGPR